MPWDITEGFEYVVNPQPQQKICFGTGIERETLPIKGPCLSPFMRRLAPETFENICANTYDDGRDAFKAVTNRHYSTKGLGPRSLRFKTKRLYQPAPSEPPPEKPIHKNCAPFNSTGKRKPLVIINDYPAPCNYLPDNKVRRIKMAYRFNGAKSLICPVQIKCVPYNLDDCALCGCLLTVNGDYWQFENRIFLCRDHYRKLFKNCLTKFQGLWLKDFKSIRDCFFAHAHNSCKASVKIMKRQEIVKKLRNEAYMDLYFPQTRFCNY